MIDLNQAVIDAEALSPLPRSATRLARIIAHSDWDPDEVMEVVRYDPALTARLLRAANSAASGSRHQITRVQDAVMRIGIGAVVGLAVAAGCHDDLDRAMPVYGVAEGELWRHGVAAAVAVECMPSLLRRCLPTECFVTALLHDAGRLVLARQLKEDTLGWLLAAHEKSGLSEMEAERALLDVHHGELGGLIATHWGLPDNIAAAIHAHHAPETAPKSAREIAIIVHAADLVARDIDVCMGEPPPDDEERAYACKLLKLSLSTWAELCDRTKARFDAVEASYC